MDKPKPCPFCGESEHIWVGYASPHYEVRCNNCGGAMIDKGARSQEEALKSWNDRISEIEY